MVMPAMVYSAKPRETLHHFRQVAKASDLPIMVYNNPPIYKTDVTPDHADPARGLRDHRLRQGKLGRHGAASPTSSVPRSAIASCCSAGIDDVSSNW